MLDAKNLLGNIDSNGLIGKLLGGMATKNFAAGLLSGGILTSLFGGKNIVENATKVGGLALLGTLAYKAFDTYQQQKLSGGAPTVTGALKSSASGMMTQASGLLSDLMGTAHEPPAALTGPSPANENPELPLAIIRAMIGAAKADGHMDNAETQKIMGQLEAAGISSDEKMVLMQEMANTPDVQAISGAARTPQDSAQIYLAALLVCDSQCASEQDFLSSLAGALKLEPAFTANLQQELLALSSHKIS
jgi:uncharacterized membrane protein YebE (DUF533 family)